MQILQLSALVPVPTSYFAIIAAFLCSLDPQILRPLFWLLLNSFLCNIFFYSHLITLENQLLCYPEENEHQFLVIGIHICFSLQDCPPMVTYWKSFLGHLNNCHRLHHLIIHLIYLQQVCFLSFS
jgi:hypothetical protein